MSQSKAAAIVAPSQDDWVVTLVGPDGSICHRRVSPSTMSKEQAEATVLKACRLPREFFRRIDSRRMSDRTIVPAW